MWEEGERNEGQEMGPNENFGGRGSEREEWVQTASERLGHRDDAGLALGSLGDRIRCRGSEKRVGNRAGEMDLGSSPDLGSQSQRLICLIRDASNFASSEPSLSFSPRY